MKEKYLILVIVLLAIGFASVSTILTINGTIKLGADADQFAKDVIFTDADTEEDGSATISNDGKAITYISKTLTTPDETTVLNFEISNKSKQYDAVATIECITDVESPYKDYIDVTPSSETYEIKASRKEKGYLTTTLKQISLKQDTISIKITCTLDVEAIGRETLPDDEDNDDTPSDDEEDDTDKIVITGDIETIGEEVSIGDEYFYVINSNETTLTLLSKYTIDINNNVQYNASTSSSTYKTQFEAGDYGASSYGYWANICTSYLCDLNDIELNENYIAAYSSYQYGLKFGVSGRLLTYQEAIELREDNSALVYGLFINNERYINYWLGTAPAPEVVFYIYGETYAIPATSPRAPAPVGVRPVIEIPRSLIINIPNTNDETNN